MTPYYAQDGITIYHGDCRDVLPVVADVLVTDPPYGINYSSSMTGHNGGTALPGIVGDADTGLRDTVLARWGDRPALVFGSWKRARLECRMILIWDNHTLRSEPCLHRAIGTGRQGCPVRRRVAEAPARIESASQGRG